ncbi:MAG: SWF/SNF helicase family protein [Lewinellaceae bacterium]|nr:SWF/SNF helicase family protein [Lewinellaceae bacterium]
MVSSVNIVAFQPGGFGLHLTAGDYVLHLDPRWNPAVEDQASDRAHRIGQTRPVTIKNGHCGHPWWQMGLARLGFGCGVDGRGWA